MQDAPDIDVFSVFNIEHQVRVARQWPEPQPGQVQFMCIARRACSWRPGNVVVSLLKCVDEAQCRMWRAFGQLVVDRTVDIAACDVTLNDRFDIHPFDGAGPRDVRARKVEK